MSYRNRLLINTPWCSYTINTPKFVLDWHSWSASNDDVNHHIYYVLRDQVAKLLTTELWRDNGHYLLSLAYTGTKWSFCHLFMMIKRLSVAMVLRDLFDMTRRNNSYSIRINMWMVVNILLTFCNWFFLFVLKDNAWMFRGKTGDYPFIVASDGKVDKRTVCVCEKIAVFIV